MNSLMDLPIFYVEWADATGCDEWLDIEDAIGHGPHEIRSIGYLIEDDEEYVTLGLSVDPIREAVAGTITIPRGMIIYMEQLEHKKVESDDETLPVKI